MFSPVSTAPGVAPCFLLSSLFSVFPGCPLGAELRAGHAREYVLPVCFTSHSALGSDMTPLPSWATLHLSTWASLKQAMKGLSVEFAVLADKAAQQVSGLVHGICPLCRTCCPSVGLTVLSSEWSPIPLRRFCLFPSVPGHSA